MRRLCGGFQLFSSYTWTSCEVFDSYGRERLWPEQPGSTDGSCHLPLAEGQNEVRTGRHRRTAETNWGFKRRERNLETRKAWWQGAGYSGRGGEGWAGRRGVGGTGSLFSVFAACFSGFSPGKFKAGLKTHPLFPSSPLQCEEHPPKQNQSPCPQYASTTLD